MIEIKYLMMVGLVVIVFALAAFLFFPNKSPDEKNLKNIQILKRNGEIVKLKAEIVSDALSLSRGLMGRKTLPQNQGMLFVFAQEDKYAFWMMNTTIPLEALHFSANGELVDIVKMEPCTNLISCPKYPPKTASKYVLEVNQGFSERNEIEISKSKIEIGEEIR